MIFRMYFEIYFKIGKIGPKGPSGPVGLPGNDAICPTCPVATEFELRPSPTECPRIEQMQVKVKNYFLF